MLDSKHFYKQRHKKILDLISEIDIEGAIISHPKHIYYLTGWEPDGSIAFLIIGGECICVLPNNNYDIEYGKVFPYEIDRMQGATNIHPEIKSALAKAINAAGILNRDVGIENYRVPYKYISDLDIKIRTNIDMETIIKKIRYKKDDYEIKILKENQSLNDRAFSLVRTKIKPGLSELDLFNLLYSEISHIINAPFVWHGCLGAGPRSALPNPYPTKNILKKNDLVLLDIFSKFDHYYSDSTRTFLVGKGFRKQREIYSIVKEALNSGEMKLQPGNPVGEVDKACRDVISSAGYYNNFPHHVGHGLGLSQQEEPFIIPGNNKKLLPGCVVTLEPGIYIPGEGGVRLENTYLITETGNKKITSSPTKLNLINQ